MNKKGKIINRIINGLLILPFIVFYKLGGFVAIFMLLAWVMMSVINTILARNVKQLLLYNGVMLVFATLGIFLCGQLYFKYICWDPEGEAVIFLEMFIEVLVISSLTLIESLIKYVISRR